MMIIFYKKKAFCMKIYFWFIIRYSVVKYIVQMLLLILMLKKMHCFRLKINSLSKIAIKLMKIIAKLEEKVNIILNFNKTKPKFKKIIQKFTKIMTIVSKITQK